MSMTTDIEYVSDIMAAKDPSQIPTHPFCISFNRCNIIQEVFCDFLLRLIPSSPPSSIEVKNFHADNEMR
jgi:hypothetical protein